jgi:putative effector of murein hydrolase LrgA (UPF0299 family)
MKKAILLILQFFLFLGVFLVGSFLHPFGFRWSETHITPTTTRYFVPDGLLIMLALYAVILIIQILTKRLRASILTTAALLLALAAGLVAKFGSVTHDLY